MILYDIPSARKWFFPLHNGFHGLTCDSMKTIMWWNDLVWYKEYCQAKNYVFKESPIVWKLRVNSTKWKLLSKLNTSNILHHDSIKIVGPN